MFKIGEFSRIGQVSVRMLRHYDKLGLLKPDEVDHFTGYRYYTLAQLPRLHRILALRDLGLSLEQISHLITEDLPPERLQGMLALKQAELQDQIEEEQKRLHRVQARLRMIEQTDHPSAYEVVHKMAEPLTVATMRAVVPTLDDMQAYRCTMFDEAYDWLKKHGIAPEGTEMVIYYAEEFLEDNIDMEIAIPVAAEVYEELGERSSGDLKIQRLTETYAMACAVHTGQIFDVIHAMTAVITWVKTNGYQLQGTFRELHLSGPENDEQDYNNVVYEIQQPLVV